MGKVHGVGVAGSALVTLGGFGAGALPVGSSGHPRLGLVVVYSGLALLVAAWWWHGRMLRGGGRDDTWVMLAWWAGPLLVAPPMFSRDVYSYLAQGLMIDSGLDPYRYGPAALGGRIAEQVPAIWQHTPSPYGPVFLRVAEWIAGPLGTHLLGGIIAMRLVAVAGLLLIAYAVRVLARHTGVPPAVAVWLAVLNPLTLIHLVGGAHNDALMVGLLAAGPAAAVSRRPILATVLVVASALVKVPAVLGLAAIALIWAAQLRGRWPRLRAGAAVLAVAAAATAGISAAAGLGYGWLGTLDTPVSPQNWSLTSALGRLTHAALAGDGVSEAMAHLVWRWAGLLATLVVIALVWVHRERLGPVTALGVALVAVVVLGPAWRPWYLLWGLVPLAAAATQPWLRRLLAGACVVLVPVTLPDGFAADGERLLLALAGSLLGLTVLLTVRLTAAPARPRLGLSR